MESLGGRTAVAAIASVVCAMVLLMPPAYAQNSPEDYLDAHNIVREELGIEPLVWDDEVAAYAQNYADQRVGDCSLIHSGGEYGENIFWGSSTVYTAADAVNLWVSERDDYDYYSNTCAPDKVCGHYTQVVWRNSLRLGCARAECYDGGVFITCNYDPPGNYEGEWPYEQLKLPRNATMHGLAS